jgi:hypothetical protein
MCRVGQNRIYTQYITVYLAIFLPKTPYIHRTYMVLANPRHVLPCLGLTARSRTALLHHKPRKAHSGSCTVKISGSEQHYRDLKYQYQWLWNGCEEPWNGCEESRGFHSLFAMTQGTLHTHTQAMWYPCGSNTFAENSTCAPMPCSLAPRELHSYCSL